MKVLLLKMDNVIRINKKTFLGRCSRGVAAIEKIAQQNALNRSGNIDFNKYGKQDGVGFIPVTEMFVDNFILRVLVPDYQVKRSAKNHLEFIHAGSTN